MAAPHKFLVPYDFSTQSEHALAYAADLARSLQGSLVVLHVGAPVPAVAWAVPEATAAQLATWTELLHEREKEAHAALERAVRPYGDVPVELQFREGEPSHTIVDAATALKADIIVLGSHGRSGLSRAVMGSVAERTARHAPCPVLIVR